MFLVQRHVTLAVVGSENAMLQAALSECAGRGSSRHDYETGMGLELSRLEQGVCEWLLP